MASASFDPVVLRALRHRGHASSPQLREGQELSLRVQRVNAGTAKLVGGGYTLLADDLVHLTPGQSLRVRVHLSGARINLEILSRHTTGSVPSDGDRSLLSRFFQQHNFSDSALARELFRGFVASARALAPDLFRRSLAQFQNAPRRSRGAGRGVLELTDRGIPLDLLDEEHASALLAWFAGDSDEHEQGKRDDARGDHDRRLSPAAALKTYLNRVAVVADHPLQLYNAMRPATTDFHWVVFPIRVTAGEMALCSVLKICWDVRERRPRQAILSIDRSNGRWWFRWEIERTARLVAAGADGEADSPPHSLLAILGGTRHTEIAVNSDGFSLETPAERSGSVDRYG